MSSRAYEDEDREERRLAALSVIRQYGDPVLRTPAGEVTQFDDELRREIDRMSQLMIDARGVGLAAPQIGALRRLLVYRLGEDGPTQALVNPTITQASEETETDQEGCLSIGELLMDVPRAVSITVEAKDGEGNDVTLEAHDYEARVIQHEMDHLDGILILDRTSKEQRREALKALREQTP